MFSAAYLYLLIGLVPALTAGHAVWRGELWTRNGTISRRETPIGFWGIVIFYLALTAFFWVKAYFKLSARP
jgi:hypothetical protein